MYGRKLLIAVTWSAALLGAAPVRADEIRVIASNAVKEAFAETVPDFERTTGHHLHVDWGGTTDIARRLEAGEVFDLAVLSGPVTDELIRKGVVREGSGRDFVESLIGAAVAPGAVKRDVSSAAGLRQSMLDAKSIVLSSGPSSLQMLALIKQFGLESTVAVKLTRLAPGLSVGEALARGEGELGFTQVSELLHIKGITLLGPLGPEIQRPTVFSFSVPVSVNEVAAGQQLIQHLTANEVSAAIRKVGLSPK